MLVKTQQKQTRLSLNNTKKIKKYKNKRIIKITLLTTSLHHHVGGGALENKKLSMDLEVVGGQDKS